MKVAPFILSTHPLYNALSTPLRDQLSPKASFVFNLAEHNHQKIKEDPLSRQRLIHEISLLDKDNTLDIILYYEEMIRWSINRDETTSIGRGTSTHSFLLYCLGITKVNPLKHNLEFEIFYNQGQWKIHLEVVSNRLLKEFLSEKYPLKPITVYGFTAISIIAKEEFKKSRIKQNISNDMLKILRETFFPRAATQRIEFLEKINKSKELHSFFDKHPIIKENILDRLDKDLRAYNHAAEFTIINECPELLTSEDAEFLGIYSFGTLQNNLLNGVNTNERELLFQQNWENIDLTPLMRNTKRLLNIQDENVNSLATIIAFARPGPLHLGVDFFKNTNSPYGVLIFQDHGISLIREHLGLSTEESIIIFRNLAKRKSIEENFKYEFENNKDLVQIKEIAPYLFSRSHALSCAYLMYMSSLENI